jgi:HlyD family secretion protein/S-layer protein transport system membrane fusion protein
MTKAAQPKADDNIKRVAFTGFAIVFVAFGAVGGWAATAPLASAVIGSGVIAAESNRKTVQHFEGGIIKKIYAREGARVNTGDVLFQLDPTQPQATYEIYRSQLINTLALESRLIAEQDNLPDVEFSADLENAVQDAVVNRAVLDQKRQFKERRQTLEGQIGLLRSRIEQLKQEIQGLEKERDGKERQVAFLNDEIDGLRDLFSRGIASKQRLLALERERASQTGAIGRALADKAKSEQAINEAELQITQAKQQFFEQVIKDLVDTRGKIADLRQRVTVARDVLRRLDVVAPTAGTIQGLKVFTVGAVIRAGDALLDIAPEEDELIVQAQFAPIDVDNVRPGLAAEVRFPSFQNRVMPMIPGTIRSVSRDRMYDEASKQSYFLGIIVVNQKDLPEDLRGRLTSGLPADLIVPTKERTVVQYLVEPLMNTLRKTMRER